MNPSETSFLVLGLVLGAAIGVALWQAVRARSAPRREVRLTITPNAVPARRASTLAIPGGRHDQGPLPGSPDGDARVHEPPAVVRSAAATSSPVAVIGRVAPPCSNADSISTRHSRFPSTQSPCRSWSTGPGLWACRSERGQRVAAHCRSGQPAGAARPAALPFPMPVSTRTRASATSASPAAIDRSRRGPRGPADTRKEARSHGRASRPTGGPSAGSASGRQLPTPASMNAAWSTSVAP